MKLESLKQDKFEMFQENKIKNVFKIVGGTPVATSYRGGSADCIDIETTDGIHTDGNGIDFGADGCGNHQ